MEGLLPYLQKSGRTVLAVNREGIGTGLYIDAVNAGNLPAATVLSTVMNKKYTATDAGGNTYPLEHYSYDYHTIYHSAQRISGGDLLRNGPGGTRNIGHYELGYHGGEIHYAPNKRFITTSYFIGSGKLLLHTLNGNIVDLDTAFNERMNIYYRENGRERLQDSYLVLHGTRLYSDTLFIDVTYHKNDHTTFVNENALIDISGGMPSVYILDAKSLPPVYLSDTERFRIGASLQLESAWDFVIYSGKAYLLTNTGEAVVFNVNGHTLRYEETVPWREFRIPGWKGGEWIFVSDGMVTAYNISVGSMRQLGRHLENYGHHPDAYFYEGTNGRRFIVESEKHIPFRTGN